MKTTHKDVDSYIDSCDPRSQEILTELRFLIKKTIPEVNEIISYNVPFYKYYGEFVGFAAYKNHISFGFGSNVLQDDDRKMLEEQNYKLGKGTMQIKFHQSIPSAVIKNVLLEKAKSNKANKLSN